MESLGSVIRKRRKELNLNQSEVAGAVMSTAKLSNIENDKIMPDIATLKYLQEKLRIPELYQSDYSKERISFLMEQALTYVHSGLRELAIPMLEEVEEATAKALVLSTWAEARDQLIRLFIETGRYNDALERMSELENYYKENENNSGYVNCLQRRAYIYFQRKDFTESIRYYEKALEMVGEDFKMKGQVYYNLAAVYYELHDVDRSSLYCDKALIEWDHSPSSYGVYMLQGILLQKVGMVHLAKEKLRLAKKVAIETKNHIGLAKTWHNIGHMEMQLENYKDAFQSFQLSLELKTQNKDHLGIARTKSYLCLLYAKQGNYELAEQVGLEALHMTKDLGQELDELTAQECLSEMYQIIGKMDRATHHISMAIDIAIKFKIHIKLKEFYDTIAYIYDQLGDRERCLAYLVKRMRLTKERR